MDECLLLLMRKCLLQCINVHFSLMAIGSTEEQYKSVYRSSLQNPEEFWAEAADALIWTKRWSKVTDNSQPPFTKW